MNHFVIATHGTLATGIIETARMICGDEQLKDVHPVCMTEEKSPEDFQEELQTLLDQDPQGNYFILADLYGASPCNTCLLTFRYANYRMVTGLNLGMLLEVLMIKDNATLEELETIAMQAGKEGVKKAYLRM